MNKLILIPIILAILFGLLLAANFVLYKTWGNNENYYASSDGIEIECDLNLLQKPTNCRPIFPDNGFPNSEKGSITIESDSRNTGNPTQCWYNDEDGIMKPCGN